MTDQIIYVLRGYAGSGKTTMARTMMEHDKNLVRVSRDSIRSLLTGRTDKFAGDFKFETLVSDIQERTVRAVLASGKSVIIDDTNLKVKYAKRWLLLARSLGVESDVININTPLAECLERNEMRIDGVPSRVIKDQAKRYPMPFPPLLLPAMEEFNANQYTANPNLPPCITVDLDGTLAHHNGRNPYDTSRYMEDSVDGALLEVLNHLAPHFRIVVFTGRNEDFRDVCEQWLDLNDVPYDGLIMRKSGDSRKDSQIKGELFDEFIAPNYRHVLHFDDRARVVEALRAKGLLVAQVAPGLF